MRPAMETHDYSVRFSRAHANETIAIVNVLILEDAVCEAVRPTPSDEGPDPVRSWPVGTLRIRQQRARRRRNASASNSTWTET
jgi:hypothetical protein